MMQHIMNVSVISGMVSLPDTTHHVIHPTAASQPSMPQTLFEEIPDWLETTNFKNSVNFMSFPFDTKITGPAKSKPRYPILYATM